VTFDYHEPRFLTEALELLDRYGDDAHLIAGGTATVLLIRQGLLRPGHVIGLRAIEELRGITRTADGGLRIGAMATHRAVERSSEARLYSPALTDAFASVATVRIRNQATVGGNLAHADPAQDPPPMLSALNATVSVRSSRGERSLPIEELAVDHFTTSLAHDEVITAVILPPIEAGSRETYLKFLPKTADDYATVSVAATLRFASDGTIAETRIVLGAVGATPIRARRVEGALRGQPRSSVRDAVALVSEEIDPIDDLRGSAAYKREMARVWTGRALAQVTR
jgi:aerobic carbon-monoxide dehydrogenase medium subunit